MNYEELKIIWDSQNDEPLFAINQEALNKTVKNQTRSIQQYVNVFEITIILCAFSVAILLPIDAWRDGESTHHYFISIICLTVGVYVWLGRKKRLDLEVRFTNSVSDVIKKSLTQIEYHTKNQQLYFWLFHFPIALASGIGLSIYSKTNTSWIWSGLLLVTAISYWSIQRDIKKNLQPKQQNLKSLLRKLDENA